MAINKRPTLGRLAVPAFLELLATVFAGVGADNAVRGGFGNMIICILVALFFFFLGIQWNSLAPNLSKRLIDSATVVATDFRWWMAIVGLVFLYIIIPKALDAPSSPSSLASLPAVSGERIFLEIDMPLFMGACFHKLAPIRCELSFYVCASEKLDGTHAVQAMPPWGAPQYKLALGRAYPPCVG